jgi:hypothetical protein
VADAGAEGLACQVQTAAESLVLQAALVLAAQVAAFPEEAVEANAQHRTAAIESS